jgi:hypothetical protein
MSGETMTRQQLETIIDRQLAAFGATWSDSDYPDSRGAHRRAILAAIDDWAASQVTPVEIILLQPTLVIGPSRTIQRLRSLLAKALDTTTGGTR